MSKKTLAVVSSYDEMCGNATYTYSLVKGLSEFYDVKVLRLNLPLLQSSVAEIVAAGERHIEEIARELKDVDYVNIQFEQGLYGPSPRPVASRVCKLIQASRNLVFTFHRIDPPTHGFTIFGLVRMAYRRRYQQFFGIRAARAQFDMYRQIVAALREKSKSGNAWAMVHTEREKLMLQEVYGLSNVVNFPLTFLHTEEREHYRNAFDKQSFLKKHGLSEGNKYIGAFGFFGGYKGHDTLLKSLRYLPNNFDVVLFGSQHPQSIQPSQNVAPSVDEIISRIEQPIGTNKSVSSNLKDRVHFRGTLDDDSFIEALMGVDAVALPYLEVGQGMSGIIALAHEVDATIVAANNLSFIEFQRYFGKVYYPFDIGNHIELAQRLVEAATFGPKPRQTSAEEFSLRGNAKLYSHLLEGTLTGSGRKEPESSLPSL